MSDNDGPARYAAIESIEVRLKHAHAVEAKAHREVVFWEALREQRREQIARGDWPTKSHDDDWWAAEAEALAVRIRQW